MKLKWRIDDSLDVFAVHGVGGMIGIILTAVLATGQFGGMGLGDGVSVWTQLLTQVAGVLVTVIWAVGFSFIILKVIEKTMGLRVSIEDEIEGLDITAHGERGYHM
jgi:Amt family ammonium transporter